MQNDSRKPRRVRWRPASTGRRLTIRQLPRAWKWPQPFHEAPGADAPRGPEGARVDPLRAP